MAEKFYFEGKKSPYNYEVLDSKAGEMTFAQSLEDDSDVIAWTKMHKIAIPYRNKKGVPAKYYPDFLVRRKNQLQLELVEIKGHHLDSDPNNKLKQKAAHDWCFQRGMKYIYKIA